MAEYKGVPLPEVGGDRDTWGDKLNDETFPAIVDRADSALADATVEGTTLSFTRADGGAGPSVDMPQGPEGPEGPQGAPGGSDEATAEWIENGTLTKAALTTEITNVGASLFAPSTTGIAATQTFLSKVKRGVENVRLLVMSDSTNGWVPLLADLIAADWPTHTVEYTQWDADSYPDMTVRSTGTGPCKISVYNLSTPGWQFWNFLGTAFNPGIAAMQPDLIVTSIMHNETDTTSMAGRMMSAMESVTQACPHADVVMVAQNPARNNNSQAFRASKVQEYAAERGFGFIDVHQFFIDAGMPAEWYVDQVHPSATGLAQWAAFVHRHFVYRADTAPLIRQPSSLLLPSENLIPDGALLGYTGGLPTPAYAGGANPVNGWVSSNLTMTKDTSRYDSPKGFSLKMTANAAGQSYLRYQAAGPVLNSLRGQWVTFAARTWVAEGSPAGRGRCALIFGGGTAHNEATMVSGGRGDWVWHVIPARVDDGATYLQAQIYGNVSSTDQTDGTYVDRVILARGNLLRDTFLT